MPTRTAGRLGPLLLAALAAVAHLVVGYFYVVSGLAVPLYALLPLWLLWLVLALVLIRLAILRSWWTPLVPVGAAALLVGAVVAGGSVVGWQA